MSLGVATTAAANVTNAVNIIPMNIIYGIRSMTFISKDLQRIVLESDQQGPSVDMTLIKPWRGIARPTSSLFLLSGLHYAYAKDQNVFSDLAISLAETNRGNGYVISDNPSL